MLPEATTHALLRIGSADCLENAEAAPGWVSGALRRAPWVVVRRVPRDGDRIPVGVRGAARGERYAGWLPTAAVRECLTPRELAARRGWHAHPRRDAVAALAALAAVETLMRSRGLATSWGPAGSVGFELASGCETASPASDLDLIVLPEVLMPGGAARALAAELTALPARVDVLIELPGGSALALGELARATAPYLLRTPQGARRVADPWSGAGMGR
ncbi:MAG TPA: malonate decarboxylase holo-ACP synthase [Steroidobacteraceae bacterium]|nr:malonate decarboxylase holo-ACP synthase [Steroidobacteraceae bacterium]